MEVTFTVVVKDLEKHAELMRLLQEVVQGYDPEIWSIKTRV